MIRSAAKDKSKESKEAKTLEIESGSEQSTLVEETVRSPSKSICATELSGSEEEASEVESFILEENDDEHEPALVAERYLLSTASAEGQPLQTVPVDPETHARLEALLEAAGISKLSSKDGKALTDPEVLRTLTSSVSSALDEAAQALHRMRNEQQGQLVCSDNPASSETGVETESSAQVRKVYDCNNVGEASEEGESLLSLACSAGYYELAQVLLAMKANVEDRGVKGDCTPLMEAASGGHVDIVKLLINHNADINAQSTAGNTPLHYAACGGYKDVVAELLRAGASVEVHNENGHTPLMEAASAGHVDVAKLLLESGAGINTHSNEFKESALTLACYKGHLDMVTFLLAAGADQEHKTDEMHTALMEASMDGHVEVARLLLDSGAQVNMPADSFESPLTLAACGGHVDLANLLIERGANIEEVNDEGYTPLMEAAREGHEEMVALLLGHGAQINAQTEETQETALTLACCGGFLDVAEFLIKRGANIELGCSTPLMEAAQEGHLELVKYLLNAGANVHAQTATGDTALTYACENGHTDVAGLLLDRGAELEHESEGGRTPLMKAARAGHLCTVQFLINKGANVNRATTTNDHTVLSLACAGGHQPVVELLLCHGADYNHKLKDGSTMIIEAAKGGHTLVVTLLLEWPTRSHDLVLSEPSPEERVPTQGLPHVVPPNEPDSQALGASSFTPVLQAPGKASEQARQTIPKSLVKRCPNGGASSKSSGSGTAMIADTLQQLNHEGSLLSDIHHDKEATEKVEAIINSIMAKEMMSSTATSREEQLQRKQQILEELQKVERELQEKAQAQLMLSAGQMDQQPLLKTKNSAKPLLEDGSPSGRKKPEGAVSLDSIPGSLGMNSELTFNLAPASYLPSGDVFSAQAPTLHSSFPDAFLQQPFLTPQNNGFIPPDPAKQGSGKSTAQAKRNGNNKTLRASKGKEQSGQPAPLVLNFPADQLSGSPSPDQQPSCDSGASSQQEAVPVLPLQANSLQFSEQILKQVLNPPPTFTQPVLQPAQAPAAVLTQQQQQQLYQQQQQHAQILQQQLQQIKQPPGPNSPSLFSPASKIPSSRKQQRLQFQPNTLPAPPSPQGSPVLGGEAATPPPSLPATPNPSPASPQSLAYCPSMDLDAQTESNHDTALTLACAGGHAELVQLLLNKGAEIEHRDKKGFTPLILAATAGHTEVVEILLDHQADIEAQSERTKDTPLSLACSGGRYEVVELLLNRGANKEHRNVSDYTPLSLAASGGYVSIIKLLLSHGAEINSRTGSKLGISPLMLASMNGHTAAVKLLLDMGSDINAQIETNKNTALTLACFQGRHEVVSLLVDRRANIEHRAKTGLTPLMEAASGGYVEVGRVLLDKGADVNAPPVPSSRDTALTIAADKGHYRFVELLVQRGAAVDVKNKKGNSPTWLACNGGHLDVVQLLVTHMADKDSQDNRKVSCLMAAFRKGHVKVVKWLVKKVLQFPSDTELKRFISQLTDKEMQKKCQTCMDIITHAKEHQAAEANKHANSLLQEIDKEREEEELRKAAAAAKRERRRKKKKEKMEKEKGKDTDQADEPSLLHHASKNSSPEPESGDSQELEKEEEVPITLEPPSATTTSTTGMTLTTKADPKMARGKHKQLTGNASTSALESRKNKRNRKDKDLYERSKEKPTVEEEMAAHNFREMQIRQMLSDSTSRKSRTELAASSAGVAAISDLDEFTGKMDRPCQPIAKRSNLDRNGTCDRIVETSSSSLGLRPVSTAVTSPKRGQKKDDGWREVVSKSQAKTDKQQKKSQAKGDRTRKKSGPEFDMKKVQVSTSVVSRVIGRGGHNINTIRVVSGAHCDVEKARSDTGTRYISIKGTVEATSIAHKLIIALTESDKDISDILALHKLKMPDKVPTPNPAHPAPNLSDSLLKQMRGLLGESGANSTRLAMSQAPGAKTSTAAPKVSQGVAPSAWQSPPAAASLSPRRSPQKQVVAQQGRLPGAPGMSGEKAIRQQLFPLQTDGNNVTSSSSIASSPAPAAASLNTATYTTSAVTTKLSCSVSSSAATKEAGPGSGSKGDAPAGDGMKKVFMPPYPPRAQMMAQVEASSYPVVTSNTSVLPSTSVSAGVPVTPAEFSPFNHHLNIASNIGMHKSEQERMNYSSVAAAGVGNSLVSSLARSTSPALEESGEDPQLLSKAPGYKSVRTASPQYRSSVPKLNPTGYGYELPLPLQHEMEPMPRMYFPGPSLPPGHSSPRSNPSTPSGLSPRSQSSTPHSQTSGLNAQSIYTQQPSPREEYCSPQQPMTLPEIKSALNANAPDFQMPPKVGSLVNGNYSEFSQQFANQVLGPYHDRGSMNPNINMLPFMQQNITYLQQMASQGVEHGFRKPAPQPRPNSAPTMVPMAADGPAGPIGPPKAESPLPSMSTPLSEGSKVPRPIGGERAQRKAHMTNGPLGPTWRSPSSEFPSEWESQNVSTMMTMANMPSNLIISTSLTGGNMVYSFSNSHPEQRAMGPELQVVGGYADDLSLNASPVDQHGFGNPSMVPMLPREGIPPSLYRAPAPMYAPQGPVQDSRLWNQGMKSSPESGEAENWRGWSPQAE